MGGPGWAAIFKPVAALKRPAHASKSARNFGSCELAYPASNTIGASVGLGVGVSTLKVVWVLSGVIICVEGGSICVGEGVGEVQLVISKIKYTITLFLCFMIISNLKLELIIKCSIKNFSLSYNKPHFLMLVIMVMEHLHNNHPHN